jgi:hypothetical protein
MSNARTQTWIWSSILGTTLVASAGACGEGTFELYDPDAGQITDAGSTPDASDAGTDDGGEEDADAAPSCETPCEGNCIPYSPVEGDGTPVLLRLGKSEEDVPSCPDDALSEVFAGHGGFSVTESTCSPCACGFVRRRGQRHGGPLRRAQGLVWGLHSR